MGAGASIDVEDDQSRKLYYHSELIKTKIAKHDANIIQKEVRTKIFVY